MTNHPRQGVEVYYDVHPDERGQHDIGEELRANPPAHTRAIPFNSLASMQGVRFICCNPTLIRLDVNPEHRCPERNALKARQDSIAERRPLAVLELHNAVPTIHGQNYDSAAIIHSRPTDSVRKLAAHLALQGVPIIESPGSFLPATVRQGVLLEMDERDPRFSYKSVRRLITQVAADTLPDAPLPPLLKFQADIKRTDAQAVGIDTDAYKSPFSSITPEQAVALGLHADTRVMNIVRGEANRSWAVALTACSQAITAFNPMLAPQTTFRTSSHWCDTLAAQPELMQAA